MRSYRGATACGHCAVTEHISNCNQGKTLVFTCVIARLLLNFRSLIFNIT